MRVIAGQWRGRALQAPKGQITRPTADRVRESVFSMLISRIGSFEGLRIADLFAGSGALGFEALSRGAAQCSFVDHDRTAIDTIRANAATLGASTRCDILSQSAARVRDATAPADVLFLDPPYGHADLDATIAHLVANRWIGPASWVSLETARGQVPVFPGLTEWASRDIGKARVTLLRMET